MAKLDLDKLLDDATERLKKFEHPYVGDLIRVLKGHPSGRPRQRVIEILERERKETGLPMPRKFEESVQNAYNRYASGYSAFEKNKKPGEQPVFHSPSGKGGGIWSVDEDAAASWLLRHIPPLLDFD